jgi:PhnB protein
MSQIAANPYINFQGHAREALEFYHEALGGDITLMAADSNGSLGQAGPEDSIMHGAVMSDGLLIMGSDGHPDYPPTLGDNVAIALSGSDRERLTLAFDKLSADGIVKQPLKTESWGDLHGYFIDKFGINWMVNISPSATE